MTNFDSVAWLPQPIEVLGSIAASEYPLPAQFEVYNGATKFLHIAPVAGAERHPEEPAAAWKGHTFEDYDMDLPQAWAITKGSPSVVIAIQDSGLNWDSLEFDGQFLIRDPMGIDPETSPDCPGNCNEDEDGDGKFNEDLLGRVPGDTGESDLIFGRPVSVLGDFALGACAVEIHHDLI